MTFLVSLKTEVKHSFE